MIAILEQTPAALRDWFIQHDLPGHRAGQIHKWLFQKRAATFDAMTDLSAALRKQLADEFQIWTTQVVQHHTADDGSEKLLLELHDSQRIECVLLRDDKQHRTVCISTQIGCAMGCAFCATGIDGVARNLTAGEIVEQVLQLQRLLPPKERLSNVVVMGMGEPLLNIDGLMPALAVVVGPDALNIGVRRVTISTVGLPEGIRRLARENCPFNLAVSLHAATDELRNKIVPANRGFGVAAILAAVDEYFQQTGRRVTFEYVLLAGVNDQTEHAQQLVKLLRGRPALVNLIPYNPVQGLPFRTPASTVTARFLELLTQDGLNVIIRYRKGDRISAACGQLRRVKQKQPPLS